MSFLSVLTRTLTLAALAERCGIPRPACGERATRAERTPEFGPVRGRLHKLRLAEAPPHPDLLPACGEKETSVHLGHVRSKRQTLVCQISWRCCSSWRRAARRRAARARSR